MTLKTALTFFGIFLAGCLVRRWGWYYPLILDLFRWWFFTDSTMGFITMFHHHLGILFYFFQPPNKQIQGYIGVTINPALEDSISASLDFMSGNFRIFWSWLVCLCLKMMVYISPMWLKTHTNSENFSWFGLLGFIYAYFLPVHYDKSVEYVWMFCPTIFRANLSLWSFRASWFWRTPWFSLSLSEVIPWQRCPPGILSQKIAG